MFNPGLGRPPGEGHGNPLQHSCMENSMDRGARRATVHAVAKESDTTERLTLSRERLGIYVWEVNILWTHSVQCQYEPGTVPCRK